MTYQRVSLVDLIDDARALRDLLAVRERTAREVGALRLSGRLGELAAVQDRVLASLLAEKQIQDTKAQALPGA